MIIIPDIHGRSFWKEAVKQRKDDEKIIFLGDYLDIYQGEIDSYTNELITNRKAIENFEEIIDFAHNNKNIVLLLGNHDIEYIYDNCTKCRCDLSNYKYIRGLFERNKELFSISHIDNNVIFSHAGFTEKYCSFIFEGTEQEGYNMFQIADHFNNMWRIGDNDLGYLLNYISHYRGGIDCSGSPVWADLRDMMKNGENGPYQIFGHSQYNSIDDKFMISDYMACLDCRAAFRYENSKLTPITKVEDAKFENF